jgi:hypothetical protein
VIVSAPPRRPSPPLPPPAPDPEALIEEARQRQRARRRRLAVTVLAVTALGSGAFVALAGGASHGRTTSGERPRAVASRTCPGVNLGTVAFVRGSALAAVDLRTCATRVLVPRGVVGPVQISADGRYVAFNGGFVASGGGAVRHTHGAGIWSPSGDLLAVTTAKGGLALVAPNGATRTLLPDGWGATTFAFSPNGRMLAVTRSLYAGPSVPPPYHQEIWTIDLATGRPHLIFRQAPGVLGPPWLAGYSPDGRWLTFWIDTQNSASLAADGLPLLAIRAAGGRPVQIAGGELHYRDFMTWCGNALVYVVDHGGRLVTQGDGVAAASPPAWRRRTILPAGGPTSWNSVACPTAAASARGGGGLAIAAGPSSSRSMNAPPGSERRSIWLGAPTSGTKPALLAQTVPPRGQTDELPMWSGDGRWILFVRTKPHSHGAGSLYALDPFGGNLVGPIAQIGRSDAYYGAYGWAERLDWHR